MLIELHIIQNFAPSCLNRDDTNTPKDCTFGGVRRARISSQCFKRAIRTSPVFTEAVANRVGVRTKLLLDRVVQTLKAKGKPEDEARRVAQTALMAAGYKLDGDKTSVLLFLSPGEIELYAATILEHYDVLMSQGQVAAEKEGDAKAGKAKKGRDKSSLPKEVLDALKRLGSKSEAADIALFGRMVAENTNMNIEAACQVAHAISTHESAVEMDFFTAVDDLQPEAETGAGMMGVVEYNSACFYRYAVVDLGQLATTLEDAASVRDAVIGFCKAAVAAIPTGKQHSMAAQNLPSYVQVRVRQGGSPWSLVNAFVQPVRPDRRGTDLVEQSIARLRAHDEEIQAMYGRDGIVFDGAASTYAAHGKFPVTALWEAVAERLT